MTQGAVVSINLRNNLTEDTSLVFPGMDGVLAAGQPSQPVAAPDAPITSLAPVAAANGGTHDLLVHCHRSRHLRL